MAFPTLSSTPSNLGIQSTFNTISSQFDGGYKMTRERFTRDIKKIDVEYILLTRADKDLIEAHYDTVRGSVAFNFTNIDTSITYSVRYTEAPKFEAKATTKDRFSITLKMEVV